MKLGVRDIIYIFENNCPAGRAVITEITNGAARAGSYMFEENVEGTDVKMTNNCKSDIKTRCILRTSNNSWYHDQVFDKAEIIEGLSEVDWNKMNYWELRAIHQLVKYSAARTGNEEK